jgi:hypothetical protein
LKILSPFFKKDFISLFSTTASDNILAYRYCVTISYILCHLIIYIMKYKKKTKVAASRTYVC